jgi:hypothetical protein
MFQALKVILEQFLSDRIHVTATKMRGFFAAVRMTAGMDVNDK